MDWKVILIAAILLLAGLFYALNTPPLKQAIIPATEQSAGGQGVYGCISDEECGVSGFTGVYACRGDNVFGEYVTYFCASAGNKTACMQFTSLEFIKNCAREGRECASGLRECQQNSLI
jgi:hypothetical protein